MLDAEWSVDEVADVTLVEVTVHNPTAVDRRVRVDDRLDGPTLPPRTDGTAERGWDANGYEGVVPAGERLSLGYASPSPPAEPPVSVEDEGRADGDGDGDPGDDGAGASDAVRLLGDAAPPADAVPSSTDGEGLGPTESSETRTDENAGGTGTEADDSGDGPAAVPVRRPSNESEGSETTRSEEATADAAAEGDLPGSVADWLGDVEGRVDHAERLTGASVVEAAAVLDERGGLAGVEALSEQVETDEAALRAIAERATALADRAASTDVPVAALRRLS